MRTTSVIETPAKSYDTIIIGSGMGGSALALRLGQAGQNVLIVERGEWAAGAAEGATRNPYLYHRQSPEDDFNIIGGRSKFYGATMYRLRRSDFERRKHEDGVSPGWPVGYDELEPYYAEAEALYRVHGAPDGDPTEPKRSSPFPHPPIPHDPEVGVVVEKLEASGAQVAPIPKAIDYGDGGACVLCAECDAYLCRYGAKMDAETATLRPALQTGRVHLLAQAECQKILMNEAGDRAEGVRLTRRGVEIDIAAGVVVLSAGTPHTAHLLRKSRTDRHPGGVGDHSGWLGRGVGAHSTGWVFPLIRWTSMGPRHVRTFAMNERYDGEPGWPFPMGVAQVAGQAPIWEMASPIKRPVIKAVAERSLNVFYMTESTPDKSTGWIFEGDEIVEFAPPRHQPESFKRLREYVVKAFRKAGYPVIKPGRSYDTWHETGSAVMAADPADGVVDSEGRVYGLDNLYVADASVLPSAGAVNTGLTIVALALRTGDVIAGRGLKA